MDTAKQIEKVAISTFLATLTATTANSSGFRILITTTIDGSAKPLLMIGTVHGSIEDGHVIAILNPDIELCDQIKACCGYTPFILKEIVAKRCDMMVDVGISAYKSKPVNYVTTYQAREPKPAKFLVQ